VKISPSEHDEQVGFINWFRAKYPSVLIFAIPNGEKRAISVAKRLKAEGVVRGVPDLYVPAWKLWIEMKRASGGRLSPDQKEMINYLESIGNTVIIGKGASDASKKVLEFMEKG
jgi:hypothetical protein|tara:strand:+ start:11879 stop:12220 length:342 start_codon:yes stop_codon:yes gene_type:complete